MLGADEIRNYLWETVKKAGSVWHSTTEKVILAGCKPMTTAFHPKVSSLNGFIAGYVSDPHGPMGNDGLTSWKSVRPSCQAVG